MKPNGLCGIEQRCLKISVTGKKTLEIVLFNESANRQAFTGSGLAPMFF